MAFRKKKPMRVNTMYGADGRLRTAYFEGEAAAVAKKNVKAFNKELTKYEKAFADYASLDIESSKVNDLNTRYIFGKLGIAEKYVDYVPEDDISAGLGEEMTAIVGNKSARKLGIGAKIASKFQPFFEKQAEKHPRLRGLSDRITKAANNGRMPLTADSAAMMRIAFDKKYYNDCRHPGADKEALCEQYNAAVENLTKMAAYDGVESAELSAKFSEKLITQMQVDETLTDIYKGMADGSIRLADNKAVLNADGKKVTIGGKTLYERSTGFVSSEKDAKGNNKPLDAWDFEPREPQSIEEILSDYQAKLDKYAQTCTTEADFKRLLASDSFKNLERNAKAFAEADCPDEAAKFKYEFARTNIISCRNWALANDNKSPYARMIVPPPWDEHTAGNDFLKSYAVGDYYSVDEQTEIYNEAVTDVATKTDDELATDMADDYVAIVNEMSDTDKINARLNELEAENKALREQIFQMQASQVAIGTVKATLSEDKALTTSQEQGFVTEKESDTEIVETKTGLKEKVAHMADDMKNAVGKAVGTAVVAKEAVSNARAYGKQLIADIKAEYGNRSETILAADVHDKPIEIETTEQPKLMAAEAVVSDENVIEDNAVKTETPDLSGRIEKYGLDIDFTKIDFVEIEKACESYVGGYDENGHERFDNYDQSTNDILIYAASNGETLLIYDAENNDYDVPIGVAEAFDRITTYLDESATYGSDTAVYIKPLGEEKQQLDAVALRERVERENKTVSEVVDEIQAEETVSHQRFAESIGTVDATKTSVSAEPDYP